MNSDGSDQRRLTPNPARDGSPAWSPDGQQLAFQTLLDRSFEIAVVNVDGSGEGILTRNPAQDYNALVARRAKNRLHQDAQ